MDRYVYLFYKHSVANFVLACFPFAGYDFLLFHQRNKNELQAVKLTGGPLGPRGTRFIVADDLNERKEASIKGEWFGLPAVPVKAKPEPTRSGEGKTMSVKIDEDLVD